MTKNAVQSELYAELGIYRSKMDGSRAIARKADLLATVLHEKVDHDYIAKRMAEIDGADSSSNDLLANTLGLFPGWIGAAGRILGKANTLYESAQSMVEGKRGSTPGADDWEGQLRNNLELLDAKAENDPAVAKLIDQYLGDKLGPINASAEETLAMYPAFKDSKALEALRELVTQDHATAETIAQGIEKLQNDMQEARASAEAQKRAELTFEDRMQEIAEQRLYCRLAVRILHEVNPEAARATGAILQGVMDAQEIGARLDAGRLTAAAATGSYVLVAMSVLDGFQSGGADEALQGRLDQIVQLIVDLSQNVTARLEQLQATADLILTISALDLQQAIENKALIVDLQRKADELHTQIFEQGVEQYQVLVAGFDRPLVDSIGQAFNHKQTYKPGTFKLSRDKFNECLSEFITAAGKFATDGVALPPDNESVEETDLLEGLSKRPLAANLPYLARAITKYGGLAVSAPQINFDLWQRSVIALIDLIGDWPEYQDNLEPHLLDPYISDAAAFERFFTSMQCVPPFPAVRRIGAKQAAFAKDVLTALNQQVLKNFSNAVDRSMLFEPASFQYADFAGAKVPEIISLFERLRPRIKMTIDTDPPYSGESFEVSDEIKKYLPGIVKAAWCFRLVESVECRFRVFFTRKPDNNYDKHINIQLTASISGKAVTLFFKGLLWENWDGRFLLESGDWGEPIKLPFSRASIESEIKNVLTSPIALIDQDDVTQASPNLASAVEQAITGLIDSARRDFLQENISARDAMRSLAGMHELLNRYVAFGIWDSISDSDELANALLRGTAVYSVTTAPLYSSFTIDFVKEQVDGYPDSLADALEKAIAAKPPVPYSLKVTQQLRDLRAALDSGNRWRSDFAKRAVMRNDGDSTYYNAARSLSGSAPSSHF